MPYHNCHTAELLYKMRQEELERAIRSGFYVKHDEDRNKPHRKFAAPLFRMIRRLCGAKDDQPCMEKDHPG
ncbi:hypothetical protein M3194_16055 [Paenibacillus glycanilyticus]|uniref:hypothetical protein n=1 Tax=Paenibacillus glycanilyticus TaxID=126569 RepID=UPI00203EEED7|nr:hypothetical protein [Paenibacillus glycanilyticus]MCM3628858.1 hypothetical protein [Paenibacillus glycanilyticus]